MLRHTPRIKHDSLVGSNEECDHARLAAGGDIFWLSRIGPSLYPNTLSLTWKDMTPLPTASIRPPRASNCAPTFRSATAPSPGAITAPARVRTVTVRLLICDDQPLVLAGLARPCG